MDPEILSWADYIPLAIRTESKPTISGLPLEVMRLNHAFTGLVTEYSEIVNATSTDHMSLIEHRDEEIGDLAWYTAVSWDALKISPYAGIPIPVRSLRGHEESLLDDIATFGNALKRTIYYNKPLETGTIQRVLLSAQATIAGLGGYAFPSILFKNIKKLKLRFPDRFDTERAVNRDLAAEAGTIRR